MASSAVTLPILDKDSLFTQWRSNAKAYLKAKECFFYCTTAFDSSNAKHSEVEMDKCAGILWNMLSQDCQQLVQQHEDNPKHMWDALETIFAPRKAGARFNAYRTLTSIKLKEGESLLSLTGRVSAAMRSLKDSRSTGFDIDMADAELQAVVLLMALPDQAGFDALKAPFEQSHGTLDPDDIERAYAHYQSFKSSGQEGDSSGINPLSGAAMATASTVPTPSVALPAASPVTCPGCLQSGHTLFNCFKFLDLIKGNGNKSKGKAKGKDADEKSKEVAYNASLLTQSAFSVANFFQWNGDSGATSHMTNCKNRLKNPRPYRVAIEVANGVIVYSELIGEIELEPLLNGRSGRHIILTNALFVPLLSHNLISITYLSKHHNYVVSFKGNIVSFTRNNELLFEADINERNQAYVREVGFPSSGSALFTSGTLPMDLHLLHRRLGHHSYADTKNILSKDLVTGAKITSNHKPDPLCEPCLAGKLNAGPFPSTGHRSEHPLDLIHSDLKEYKVHTREGWKHRVTFIDDHTSFKVSYHMRRKSDAFAAFKLFKAYAENHFERKIKAFQDDKGGEYMSNAFRSFLAAEGIVHRHSTRNRPQQNGTAERANRTIDEHSTAMLHEANLPASFRALAVAAYNHVANMHPSARIGGNTTPFELWHKRKPDVSHLKVWGCLAYVHVQKDKRDASGSHIEKCIFVGYPTEYKAWEFYNPVTRKMVISERAVFDERFFPGCSAEQMKKCPRLDPSALHSLPLLSKPPPPLIDFDDEEDRPKQRIHPAPPAPQPSPPPSQPASRSPSPQPDPPPPASPVGVAARRRYHGQTTEHRPAGDWWKAHREPTPAIDSESEDELLLKPGSVLIVAHQGDPSDEALQQANIAAVQSAQAAVQSGHPRTFYEAMKRSDAHLWEDAAVSEINALLENCTWDVVDPPHGVKPIRSQWVFVIKHKSDGTIERYKARLVADGRGQRYGVDYNEIFSPTIKPATLRTIFALAAQHDLQLRSIDFSSAYLNGDLDEDVYMTQPEGFPQGRPGQLLKLRKSLYGLKQAGRQWHKKLREKLHQMGFKCLQSDRSCFIYSDGAVRIILPIYVDDGVIASKNDADIDRVIAELGSAFRVKDLGPTEWLLGIKVQRDSKTGDISISQRQYAVNMLEQYGMADCKPVSTPMLPGLTLTKEMGAKSEEESKLIKGTYISAVGSLMYLAIQTRPDISYTVGVLARFNSNPGEEHNKALKHLFRYIQGTLDYCIIYSKKSPSLYKFIAYIDPDETFFTYTDADLAGDKDTMKSTGGFVVMMAGGPVSWRSKRQTTVSLSTTEAEYVAGVDAGKEIVWMRNLLQELEYGLTGASTLLMDNQSAIVVARNPEHHGRIRHLDMAHSWLRGTVESGVIDVKYVPTQDQLADIMTKALPKPAVERLRDMMGLRGRK
jgi:transposase InsO family protein